MLVRARPLLGTIVEVRVVAESAACAWRAADAAFEAVARVHRLMSFHETGSDVSHINRSAHLKPAKVDPQTWKVLACALALSRESHGLFDCTVASRLMQLGYLPKGPQLSENADATRVHVELLEDHRVRFLKPLAVDLGGIAKGYAVDQAIDQLRRYNINAACVNAGGDLRVIGDRDWPVSIRSPADPYRTFFPLTLHDEALATTANYFAARVESGKVISPLIDPRTGACRTEDHSVSIIAPSCMLADALTKIVWLSNDPEHPLLSRYRARAILQSSADGARVHAA